MGPLYLDPTVISFINFYVFAEKILARKMLSRLLSKNEICIDKFYIIYLSLENSMFLYLQNDMNHLLNLAGLWLSVSKEDFPGGWARWCMVGRVE